MLGGGQAIYYEKTAEEAGSCQEILNGLLLQHNWTQLVHTSHMQNSFEPFIPLHHNCPVTQSSNGNPMLSESCSA